MGGADNEERLRLARAVKELTELVRHKSRDVQVRSAAASQPVPPHPIPVHPISPHIVHLSSHPIPPFPVNI